MNVDTDTQYAFTRPIVGAHVQNYDGVLKIDGEVGNKKAYDPRSYMKKAEAAWPSASRGVRGSQGAGTSSASDRARGPGRMAVVSDRDRPKTQRPAQAFDRAQRTGSTMSLHGNLPGPSLPACPSTPRSPSWRRAPTG